MTSSSQSRERQPTILFVGPDGDLRYLIERYAGQGRRELAVRHAGAAPGAIASGTVSVVWFQSVQGLGDVRPRERGLVSEDTPIIVSGAASDRLRSLELGADYCAPHPLTYPAFRAALDSVGLGEGDALEAEAPGGSVGPRDRFLTKVPHMLYGADYNPEQWPSHVVDEDVAAMQEAGVNAVSLGIFAWAILEPARDRYDFGWLDDVIERLHAGGIGVDLATPTASPPAWLIREHPEILPVDVYGVTLWHGSRRHYCPHSTAYRERAAAMASALAERYGRHPALMMWHVDNEYACHVSECFCDASATAFRDWLGRRYGDIAALNAAWSTSFWGQGYGDWEEVGPPRRTPAFVNPGQALDWRRFFSDSWLACFDEQAQILRSATPEIPITTNFMRFHPPIDYWTLAGHEDVVSDDYYPATHRPDWMVEAAAVADLMRSLGGGRPWMRMEQAAAQVNWWPHNTTKRPGVMRRGSLQAVARGADGVLFFQWRASAGGAERFHSGMLPHAGKETRTWREVVELGSELARLDELVGSRMQAEVAILFDWQNLWALEGPGLPSVALDPLIEVRSWYEAFFRRNVAVDFARPGSDLSAYRLVVLPTLHVVDDAAIENIRAFVARGGSVVLTFFSGIADAANRVRPGGYPGPFRDLVGLTVEEIVPFAEDGRNAVKLATGETFQAGTWADVIRPEGAEVVATFKEDFYAGGPAITRHRAGDGEAWYVATRLDVQGMAWLVGELCAESGVGGGPGRGAVDEAPPGVELVTRRNGAAAWTFVLNHTDIAAAVRLSEPAVEVLSGRRAEGSINVPAGDVLILRTG